jgi:uncharacterized protein YeaO (DUF488 family)
VAESIAPSAELRRWFGHNVERWPEFRVRFADELSLRPDLVRELRNLGRKGPITLVFAAHDEAHNNAAVVRDVLLTGEAPKAYPS